MDYKQASDIELWQSCRQDDLRAYGELFDRHVKPLYRQAYSYITDKMEAEELVMDLLLNLWQKRGHLKPDTGNNVKAYLMRALRNRIINHLSKKIIITDSIDLLDDDMLVESRQADYALISHEMDFIYKSKLNALSPQRRKVFQLSREENLTYAEIAHRMNLSVNTVENYMVSALNALRENMKEYSALISLIVFLLGR